MTKRLKAILAIFTVVITVLGATVAVYEVTQEKEK